jgi:hypothetical protein
MASRRESLKIIGAVGTTCAFPFSADELYGQHTLKGAGARFFTAEEFETLSQIAERIIPATGTPGAIGAGVPAYIDQVVSANGEHKKRFRAGLAGIDAEAKRRFGLRFAKLSEDQQIELLTPLSERGDGFFEIMKNMTADGYYTSKVGLVQELGYAGNMALGQFPACEMKEH